MSQRSSLRVVYIAGSGRSGSTLVERTLGAIPRWVNVGELLEIFRRTSVAQELCGCGEPIDECEFWSEVGARAFGSWSGDIVADVTRAQSQVSRQRRLPQLLVADKRAGSTFGAALKVYGEGFTALYEAIAEVAGADVIVDASKWPGQALALQRSVAVDMSLLHLVRDPRGVAYSWAKTQVHRPQGGHSDSLMASHKVMATARRWAAFQTEIDLVRRVFNDSTLMRYEDFVRRPDKEVSEALTRLGVRRANGDLRHIGGGTVELEETHGVAGNPSRFQHGSVALRADDAWKSKMGEPDRRRVTAVTVPWLVRYGYPLIVKKQPVRAEKVSGSIEAWPTVCVILPTHGRPELVQESVVSVVQQDYLGDLDIIVVHDREDTQQSLEELSLPGRRVRTVLNNHAPGLSGARNAGIDLATAAYIASCDDDDTWDAEKLRLQMTRMLSEPDLKVLGAGIRLMNSPTHIVEWPGDSPVVTREQLLRRRRKELHSSTLLVRREVYDAVGGYDEDLPSSYGEDYDFLLRAVEAGKIGVINQPLASIRQYNVSYFRERGEVVSEALQYLLQKHPQISTSRAGHARVLGQIAFASSTMGNRKEAAKFAGKALSRWPVAPHAALAMLHAVSGIEATRILGWVRKAGRGIT